LHVGLKRFLKHKASFVRSVDATATDYPSYDWFTSYFSCMVEGGVHVSVDQGARGAAVQTAPA